jgi:chromosome segregation ATPase
MAGITKTPQKKMENELLQFSQHKEDIKNAASDATKLIANAAQEAASVIAEAAAVAVKVVNVKDAEDHDLLIELRTGMGFVRSDINDLSKGVSQRISDLEKFKTDKKDFDDLQKEIHTTREDRVRKLEVYQSNFKVAMILYTSGVIIMIGIILLHIFGAVGVPSLPH